MRWNRLIISLIVAAGMVAAWAGASSAAVIKFGWSGTVSSLAPAFAAALPAGSSIAVGAPAFVRFDFESTTPDQNAATNTGNYPGALRSYTLQFGTFAFTQQVGGPVNTINTFSDPIFGFYEPITRDRKSVG